MTAYTYGSAGPAPAPARTARTDTGLVRGIVPQSRVTVLFRIFMAIPQLIVLYLMGVAAGVVTLIGWFGALFTGRLPVWAADFLAGYLRWVSRVYAYLYLLTDEYPPFTLDDADYPVRLATMPGQLNRMAVLFRLFLLIPCEIVNRRDDVRRPHHLPARELGDRAAQGPDAGHDLPGPVGGARYQIRVLGFAVMLTSAYPADLFGDPTWPGPTASPSRVTAFRGLRGSAGLRRLTPSRVRCPRGFRPQPESTAGRPADGGQLGTVADPGYGRGPRLDGSGGSSCPRLRGKLMIFFHRLRRGLSLWASAWSTVPQARNSVSTLTAYPGGDGGRRPDARRAERLLIPGDRRATASWRASRAWTARWPTRSTRTTDGSGPSRCRRRWPRRRRG